MISDQHLSFVALMLFALIHVLLLWGCSMYYIATTRTVSYAKVLFTKKPKNQKGLTDLAESMKGMPPHIGDLRAFCT